jgi:DMSO/TMAO reductase YedYZ molybdopterin-dependent catalytic subunit
MTRKQLVFTVDDLMRMPSITRTIFIECAGNGWQNWKKADPNVTVQNTHGLVSTNEWTGVPLRFLIDLVGRCLDTILAMGLSAECASPNSARRRDGIDFSLFVGP